LTHGMKILGLALALALAACGGSKSTPNTTNAGGAPQAVPAVGDGGEPLPAPEGKNGNPNNQLGSDSGPKSNTP
ncbi:MAG TPA: hypothetical protein VGC41_10965, partial [Kofleriaceae bacterium]